jgi:hypothetical protein
MHGCLKRIPSWLAAVALMAVTSGCYKATFYQNPQAVPGAQHDEWTDFFLFGLVGSETLDVRRFCPPHQVASMRTGANVGTGVISVLTIGIYTPRKVYVTCAVSPGMIPATTATLSSAGLAKEAVR